MIYTKDLLKMVKKIDQVIMQKSSPEYRDIELFQLELFDKNNKYLQVNIDDSINCTSLSIVMSKFNVISMSPLR